jgi:uridine phosphorylase
MAYPNTDSKHLYESFFTPQDFLDFMKSKNLMPKFDIPGGVIFCYQKALLEHILETEDVETVEKIEFFSGEFYLISKGDKKIGVSGKFGIGPSIVSTIMEELGALGVKRFLSIGTAGGLQKDVNVGDIMVCNKAIRDEGVSHHYIEQTKYAYPSHDFTEALKVNLQKLDIQFKEGTTWTIDAPYRETVQELKAYQAEGVLTVEMEASALAAVAQYRKLDFATAFVISDSLAELVWNPQFKSEETKKSLQDLYKAAVATLIEY